MKSLFFKFSLFLLVFTITAKADDKKIITKIQHVVVFLNGAQITRVANVNVAEGNSTLSFEGISPDIDMQSLQIKAGGDFTILSVKQELDFLNQQTKQKNVEELQNQEKQIKDKIELQTNALNVYNEEQNMLLKNQVVSGQNTNLDILKLRQALDFQTLRLTEIKKKQQAVNDQIALLNLELAKYTRQVNNIYKVSAKATSNILVTISGTKALQTQFTLTYVVKNASWYPTYDVRAKNVNSPLMVSYKANVSQQCGEDWSNIKLSLSTGNPTVNARRPELLPYYLNFGMIYDNPGTRITRVSGRITDETGVGIAGVNVQVKGSSIGTVSDNAGNYSIQTPQGAAPLIFSYVGYERIERQPGSEILNIRMQPSTAMLSEVVVTGYKSEYKRDVINPGAPGASTQVYIRGMNAMQSNPLVVTQNENQTNIEFDIANPYTIPSDGKQYLVEINQLTIPADFEYYTAPKLSTDVFLTAKVANWTQYNLLSGEANLFFEGTFIGKSLIDTRSTADTLSLSMGIDKSIVVTRTSLKDLAEKPSFSSSKKETRDWLIDIKNRKTQPVVLLVEDEIPVSQNSEIAVETQQISGGKLDPLTGKVSWTLNLSPQTEKKLNLKYQVRYPKNQTVIVQ